MTHDKYTLKTQNKREIPHDGVERDLYLFYIQYKVYIVSVLRCAVKTVYPLTGTIKLDNHTPAEHERN